jgi:uncharacterized membrane protein YdbT with pleckstrin-like domain
LFPVFKSSVSQQEEPLSYVEQNLTPGEQVVYETGLHWIVLFWPVFFAALFTIPGLLILLGSIFNMKDKDAGGTAIAGLVWLAAAGVFVLLGYLRWKATEFAVTNKRIVVKTGLLNRKTFELLLSKVESIGVEEGLMGRWLGYGLAVVKGTGGTPEPFKNVVFPQELRRQVQQAEQKVTIGAH